MFDIGTVSVATNEEASYSLHMRRIFLPVLVLFVGLGCEPAEFNPDSVDPEVEPDPSDTGSPGPTPRGVQIGSEGILTECGLRDIGGSETPPGFADSAEALAGALLGDFSGTLGPAAATVSLSATGFSAITGSGCPEVFAASLTGDLDASPELSGSLGGWALIQPGSTAVFTVWSSDWQGTASPRFDPADFDTVQLRVDGDLDASGIDASVVFEGCTGANCSTEDYGNLFAAPL